MIKGCNLIGGAESAGTGSQFRAIEAASGHPLEPAWKAASDYDIARACDLAAEAFAPYRQTSAEERAAFLETIADNILAVGDELVTRCMAETGLSRGRIEGERGRTMTQLRLFAEVLRDGTHLDIRHDAALPARSPAPRPDLRLTNQPLGPVAVFAASNFPLAFSVAGGDTASALAAGCPVLVKAHSAHPGTSELVGRAIMAAASQCGMPEGVFALLYGPGSIIGQALVAHPAIKAVGFTGSRGGGTALMRTAAARPCPIPVYAEMSSINPVYLFPGALAERAEEIAKEFIGSLTLGAGQFCTNPGLVIAVEGEGLDRFLSTASEALKAAPAQVMLTSGICQSYIDSVKKLSEHASITEIGRGAEGNSAEGQAALFKVDAETFLADPELHAEVFGAASLVIACNNTESFSRVAEALEGQLTCALHIADSDHSLAASLMPKFEDLAGRIICNGFGTGVEVAHAMVHGGPFPATSDSRSTSVGSLAIARFLRPVCYQDFPVTLLPEALK
ncbi:aldehyde dehydrogenase (NADP(+)) [Sulfitobacter sp. 915]|uniref:aldehyde dehydrogenase (NADP(+)) n=1 Tax=Sulfitobacter sp. 915 TaxID=3368558 RepID=UPI00374693B2